MNIKIRIASPEHSEIVQDILFSLGFSWSTALGDNIPRNLEEYGLVARSTGWRGRYNLTYSSQRSLFNNAEATEVFVEELTAYAAYIHARGG